MSQVIMINNVTIWESETKITFRVSNNVYTRNDILKANNGEWIKIITKELKHTTRMNHV